MRISPSSVSRLFPPQHITLDKGHGRLETREIWTSTDLNDYLTFPAVGQVFCVRRTTAHLDGTPMRDDEVVYGITSLRPTEASPARLLALLRGHWGIENRLHWVRDVTYDEDRSQVRRHGAAHVLATLRNLAISLLRLTGAQFLPTAHRFLTARPESVLRLLGV